MSRASILDNIDGLKVKFKDFFQQRKKVKSLENFSFTQDFDKKSEDYLFCIKTCMKHGFLDEIETIFLDHMIKKSGIDYLDWAHKMKWLKQKMGHSIVQPPKDPRAIAFQAYFDFDKRSPVSIPNEILATKNIQVAKRV